MAEAEMTQDLAHEYTRQALLSRAESAAALLIFLDYDGTLVALERTPELAGLSANDRSALLRIATLPGTTLVLVSGRTRAFLQEQLDGLGIDFAAEHGALFYDSRRGETLPLLQDSPPRWLDSARAQMRAWAAEVPGSFVEEKELSVAWHYRNAGTAPAAETLSVFAARLKEAAGAPDMDILFGKKVIEARSMYAGKGAFLNWYLKSRTGRTGALIICAGDDATDEEMFGAANGSGGIAVRVGPGATCADYRISSPELVLPLIEEIALRRALCGKQLP
ncbi:MAG TPA: trehalose-phosphatase [Oligoflexia bacterium]|nr:trehalose-phosphatase [Oligoflexia bacterium]